MLSPLLRLALAATALCGAQQGHHGGGTTTARAQGPPRPRLADFTVVLSLSASPGSFSSLTLGDGGGDTVDVSGVFVTVVGDGWRSFDDPLSSAQKLDDRMPRIATTRAPGGRVIRFLSTAVGAGAASTKISRVGSALRIC